MQRPEINVHSRTFISELSTIVLDGGAKEDRTPDLLRAKQALSQLSYGPVSDHAAHQQLVGLGRFELPTSPLSGVRSNHLSYKPAEIFLLLHFHQTICVSTTKAGSLR